MKRVLFCFLVIVMLPACEQQREGDTESNIGTGSGQNASVTVEQRVTQRALARWQALIAGDLGRAREFISAGMRSLTPLRIYRQRLAVSPVEWIGAEVSSVQCEQGVCRLKVDVSYRYQGRMEGLRGMDSQSSLNERWILADDEWWYVPDSA